MTVNKIAEGKKLTVAVTGRLDTASAPELEKELAMLDYVDELILDISKLDYISSAGLRVLLSTHKRMHGAMTVKGPNEMISEIFEVTGFADILNIEA